MDISKITEQDFERFWPTFQTVVEAQETYAIDPGITYEQAYNLWCVKPMVTFAVKERGAVQGSYYLKPNGAGPGGHICNCGYMVSEQARGRGLARFMCEHSQQTALELGYRAMQFNAVVSTNEGAVHLWQSMGFAVVGTIPEGFKHHNKGFVDCLVMYKKLKP